MSFLNWIISYSHLGLVSPRLVATLRETSTLSWGQYEQCSSSKEKGNSNYRACCSKDISYPPGFAEPFKPEKDSHTEIWYSFFIDVEIEPEVRLCASISIIIDRSMHYTPHVDLAFNSVEHIMRDVEGGWLLRYMHANGANMFFIVVHLHIFRGLYHASYSRPRESVRCIGVVIFLLMIMTSFIGYVLPWGQMSFWGATVVTSLASAIPVVGYTIVTWLWGGFSVDNATLNRFLVFIIYSPLF
ncbi:hypothetical protein OROHE_019751 [Orobanche hederae]